jgi:hypothetical protein
MSFLLTGAISKNHFMSIQAYLEKIDSTNLLSLPIFLGIVSIADDLANNTTLLRKTTPNIERAQEVLFHSMLLLNIFEGFATHGPFHNFPSNCSYKIYYTTELHCNLYANMISCTLTTLVLMRSLLKMFRW